MARVGDSERYQRGRKHERSHGLERPPGADRRFLEVLLVGAPVESPELDSGADDDESKRTDSSSEARRLAPSSTRCATERGSTACSAFERAGG